MHTFELATTGPKRPALPPPCTCSQLPSCTLIYYLSSAHAHREVVFALVDTSCADDTAPTGAWVLACVRTVGIISGGLMSLVLTLVILPRRQVCTMFAWLDMYVCVPCVALCLCAVRVWNIVCYVVRNVSAVLHALNAFLLV
jgi:hypothetical protein